jgi:hypothetical protein
VVTGLHGARPARRWWSRPGRRWWAPLVAVLEGLAGGRRPAGLTVRDRAVLGGEAVQRLDLAEPDLGQVVVALALGLFEDWVAVSRRIWISAGTRS